VRVEAAGSSPAAGSRWMGRLRRMQPAGPRGVMRGGAVARQMRLMEHLSRHLEERGLAVTDLTGQVVGRFLADRRAGAHPGPASTGPPES
jgi:hypothetical protein